MSTGPGLVPDSRSSTGRTCEWRCRPARIGPNAPARPTCSAALEGARAARFDESAVGLARIATSARSQSGNSRSIRPRPLYCAGDLLAVVEHQREVVRAGRRRSPRGAGTPRHRTSCRRCPQPCTRSPRSSTVRRLGRCRRSARCRGGRPASPDWAGPGRCGPARRRRCGSPRSPCLLPQRLLDRVGDCAFVCDTLELSTSAAVRSMGSGMQIEETHVSRLGAASIRAPDRSERAHDHNRTHAGRKPAADSRNLCTRECTGSICSRRRQRDRVGHGPRHLVPRPRLGEYEDNGTVALEGTDIPSDLALLAGHDEAREVKQVVVRTTIPTCRPRRSTRTTPTCVCTCCRTVWCSRTA